MQLTTTLLLPAGVTIAPPEAAAEAVAAPEAEAIVAPETGEAVAARCDSPVPTPASDPLEITASVTTPGHPEARAEGPSISDPLASTSSARALTPLTEPDEGMRVFHDIF